MGTLNLVYSSNSVGRTPFGSVSNLDSMAANTAAALGAVDNTAAGCNGAEAFVIDLAIVLGTVSATGTITLYLIQSAISTSSGFTDGISPTGTGVQGSILNATPVKQIATPNSSGATVSVTFTLPVPYPAPYWTLVALSTVALASSGHVVDYTPISGGY